MLAHCVNHECSAPVHSFSEGRLFQFEVVSISVSASDDVGEISDEKPHKQNVQFWLCGSCAASMTLRLEPARGVKLIPLGSEFEKDLASGPSGQPAAASS